LFFDSDRFSLDRHWTDREFTELANQSKEQKCLEVGCGVGNFVFPLLADNPSLFIYACDFSKRAVDMVKSNENYNESRCKAFVCDLTADKLTDSIPENALDLVNINYVL
jgi:methyltransferase-like protein 6